MINKYVAMGLGALIALAPVAAEAQEQVAQAARPPRPPPRPLPPGHTGCNGGQHDAPLAISDGTRAAPVNLRPPQLQRQRNKELSALKRVTARFDGLNCIMNPSDYARLMGGRPMRPPYIFALSDPGSRRATPLQISSSICHFSVVVAVAVRLFRV